MSRPASSRSQNRSPVAMLRLGALLALAVGLGSAARADRPFFRPARSTVPAPGLTPQQQPPRVAPTPAPSPASASPSILAPWPAEPTPTLAPLPAAVPTPALPLTDAPRFTPPGVPALKTPALPLEPGPDLSPPVLTPGFQSAPQSITSLRAGSDQALLIDVRTDFLNRLIATPRQDAGAVNDLILGARVAGEQTTQTTVSLRTIPASEMARLEVVLDGETCTRTTAVTPQVAIDTRGRQRFDLQKSVEFDGRRFMTRTPATTLDACQQNVRARTGASGIPVVNSIAETIALNQANLREPLARQETARRVTSRVVPPFNEAIDQRLGAANDWLAQLADRLPNLHDFLTSGRWSTTDQSISGQLAGLAGVSTSPPPARGGASLRIHESIAAAAASATQLQGREITIEELRRWIEVFDADLSGETPSAAPALPPLTAPGDASLRLADSDPILTEFQNGEIRVTLRASIRAGDLVELPIHRIVIGYSVQASGPAIELQPLPVTVSAETAELIVGAAVEKVIQSQIESRLEPITISPDAIPALENGARPRISEIVSQNGWLMVVFD